MLDATEKQQWGDGPWQNEPDELVWADPATNYLCAIIRNPFTGCLNGYVRVPQDHPFVNRPYQEIDSFIDVHGGLTYSDNLHFPHASPEFPQGAYWFGFDTAHSLDFTPNPLLRFPDTMYRTIEYVKAQCESLASQLKVQGFLS